MSPADSVVNLVLLSMAVKNGIETIFIISIINHTVIMPNN